jgi:peroxiredoxin
MTDRASLPDFELPATGNPRFQLSAFKGRPFVLYFHPRDDTLLSDTDEKACAIFGVMKAKNMRAKCLISSRPPGSSISSQPNVPNR